MVDMNPSWVVRPSLRYRNNTKSLCTLVLGDDYVAGRQVWLARVPIAGELIITDDGEMFKVTGVVLNEITATEDEAWPDALVYVEQRRDLAETDEALFIAKHIKHIDESGE
jgi:hypothetical protein